MLSIEEYVARRKKEDRLNEFDIDLKSSAPAYMQLCEFFKQGIVSKYILMATIFPQRGPLPKRPGENTGNPIQGMEFFIEQFINKLDG